MKTKTGKEVKTRKTDRRTLYTRNVIKDALLEALGEKNFEQITVTDVCRRAEITRATYYLHYQSLTEVLDELLIDALQLAEDSTVNLNADVEQTAAAPPLSRQMNPSSRYATGSRNSRSIRSSSTMRRSRAMW